MSYWICTKAEILSEGQIVEMSFQDKQSSETATFRLSAEDWKNIFTYKFAYESPERQMWEAHKQVARALWNELTLKKEALKDG